MQQPSSLPTAPSAPAANTGTETVTRPDPGLARGAWEAPAWAFWVALALVVVAATLYVLGQMGKLRLSPAKPQR